jgi:exosortase/archaeosortase family protein
VTRRQAIWLRVVLVPLGVLAGFLLFQHPMRVLETRVVVGFLGALGFGHDVPLVHGPSFLLAAPGHPAYWVLVLPSCSSLGALLALLGLSTVLRSRPGGLPVPLAAGIACATVFVGNIVRIASSAVVGVYLGRVALVLFHNWAGSLFGFLYTLAGFVLMLRLVLPARQVAQTSTGLLPVPAERGLLEAVPGRLGQGEGFGLGGFGGGGGRSRNTADDVLVARLGDADPARRAAAAMVLAERSLGASASALLGMAQVETDERVRGLLALAVVQRRWEPVSGPDMVSLRRWAQAELAWQAGAGSFGELPSGPRLGDYPDGATPALEPLPPLARVLRSVAATSPFALTFELDPDIGDPEPREIWALRHALGAVLAAAWSDVRRSIVVPEHRFEQARVHVRVNRRAESEPGDDPGGQEATTLVARVRFDDQRFARRAAMPASPLVAVEV